jgi:hypothetical protein
MDIFRDADNGFSSSPSRRVFGLDPSSGNILVPIDICLLTLGSSNPDFTIPASSIGVKVLTSPITSLLGKIESVDTPVPGIDVNPIVTLDRSSAVVDTIDSIDLNTISSGQNVYVKVSGGTTISGTILAATSGVTSGAGLCEQQVFPLSMSLTIQAIRVQFSTPLGAGFQGSPIFIQGSTKVLGMLIGEGTTVLACPV